MSIFANLNILQFVVTGVAMGFIYALVATEYTLIFNATGLVNFAHESFIVLGAYLFGGTFVRALELPFLVAILLTLVAMAAFGVMVSTIVLNPLRNLQFITYAMFGTMMLSRIISEVVRLNWGPIPFSVKGFLRSSIRIGSTVLTQSYLYIIGVSIVVVVGLQLFFRHTKAGKAMICVSQNKTAAALMGINVTKSINMTVAMSAALCGLIGILCAPLYNVSTGMVSAAALKGFCAGVVGGFGSYYGAIVGGILIGLLEQFGVLFFPTVYKDVVAFAVMIVFLLLRPGGIIRAKKA
ncbi:MAG: High-affinity branched-chain amino acid transport system permease protein LivH [Firmicutes bacterium ADurb.Bin467]|nr:MAG: High-affinity branched-chain amino acid transport system permease protein LivH [Firmicutes bacterium ADurb.Bin467]